MTAAVRPLGPAKGPAAYPVLRGADVHRVRYLDSDRGLFDKFLRDFVPPGAFDSHAHLYDLRACRLLRLVSQQTRDQAFSRHQPSDHSVVRTW